MPKRNSSTMSGPPVIESSKRKRPNVAEREMTKRHCSHSHVSRSPLIESSKRKRPSVAEQEMTRRHASHIVPGNPKFAGREVTREAMPDLKRLGLDGLVKQPWEIKSTVACEEYVDMTNETRSFPMDHRVHQVTFDKELLAALYDLPSEGKVVHRLKDVYEGYPSKFFRGPSMPRHGWYYKDVIDPRLERVFRVINPIVSPERCGRIKKTTALTICMAWSGVKMDWAAYLFDRFRLLRDSKGSKGEGNRKCFLSPFLLHGYRKVNAGLLSTREMHDIVKAEDNPVTRVGKTVQPRRVPGVGKIKFSVSRGGTSMQRRTSGKAQEHEDNHLCDELDGAKSGAEEENVSKGEATVDDEIRDGISEPVSDIFVQPQMGMQAGNSGRHRKQFQQREDRAVSSDEGAGSGGANSEGLRLHNLDMPSSDGIEQTFEATRKHQASHGEKTQSLSFTGSVSSAWNLLMPTFGKRVTLVESIATRLKCNEDDILLSIDGTQRDQARLYADLHQREKQLGESRNSEKLLQEQLDALTSQVQDLQKQKNEAEAALEISNRQINHWKKCYETANSLFEDGKKSLVSLREANISLETKATNLHRKIEAMHEKNSAAEGEFRKSLAANVTSGITRRLEKELAHSCKVRDDALSAMSHIHALNMTQMEHALGKFQDLLQEFEIVLPGKLENLITSKMNEQLASDEALTVKIINGVAATTKKLQNSVSECRKELGNLFSAAKDMRDTLGSQKLRVSEGSHTLTEAPENGPADAIEILMDAEMQLRADNRKEVTPEFATSPMGNHETLIQPGTRFPTVNPARNPAVKNEKVGSSDEVAMTQAPGPGRGFSKADGMGDSGHIPYSID